VRLIWFVVGLCLLLARAEGSPPWRSAVALVSGVLLPTYLLLDASWNVSSFGAHDLDLAVASYAFDTGKSWARQHVAGYRHLCGVLRLGHPVDPSGQSLAWLVGDL